LEATDHALTKEEILGYMLSGMGPEYEPLVAALTSWEDVISLKDIYAIFLSTELRLE
jgi:hypothetical protein